MGTGPKKWTEEVIARRVKEGRGQGIRSRYSPWIYVQEFSSRGTQTRIPSLLFDRTIHTFSYLERNLYLLLEFQLQKRLLDYREQFPMERRTTLAVAQAFDIRHPRYPKTNVPVVMTLDAVVEFLDKHGQRVIEAWDVKPSTTLSQRRTQEKLSLHKGYCALHEIKHTLVTETSFKKAYIDNIIWLRGSLPKRDEIEVVPGLFTAYATHMLEDLWRRRPNVVIHSYCAAFDQMHHLPQGSALRLLKVLLWQRELTVDLNAKRIELERVPYPALPPKADDVRLAA